MISITRNLMIVLMAVLACQASAKPHVVILTTGGTIANTSGSKAIDGQTLIGSVPQLLEHAAIDVEEIARVNSSQITPEHWLLLANRINTLFHEDRELSGIVLTHGTDTLEDTAFFLNATVNDSRPVVITGAMRLPHEISSDGPSNLLNAVRVAGNSTAVGKGVLVVINERIATARDVWKTDNRNVDTFRSPELGFLGFVDPQGVVFYRKPIRGRVFDVSKIKELPKIAMLIDYPGFDPTLIEGVIQSKPAGLVMASFAGGHLSDGGLEAVARATAANIPVVIASHVPGGRIVGNPLENLEAVVARDLPPNKARILLMLALTRTHDLKELQRIFETVT